MQALRCHLCGSEHLEHLSGTESFVRVTSDCQVWKPGGRLAQCQECALVQAEITPAWIEGCDHIYRNYDIYHQAGGIEQSVFNDQGSAQTRSRQMLEFVRQRGAFPTQGKVLDIGCGNGSFLAEFSRNFSQWELHGLEYNSKHLDALQSIPRFHKLHSQNLSAISPKQFDLICLIHTLEHIVNPLQFLKDVANLLTDDGVLFIQVPHYPENPFELFTADHASHFTVGSLSHLLTNCGFAVQSVTTQWVRREISLIAKLQFAMAPPHPPTPSPPHPSDAIQWLAQFVAKASETQQVTECFGLFGSSIAATWTSANLPHLPQFFVDEDPARAGNTHLGRPIFRPSQVPAGSTIFLALDPATASAISSRWSHPSAQYVEPPV